MPLNGHPEDESWKRGGGGACNCTCGSPEVREKPGTLKEVKAFQHGCSTKRVGKQAGGCTAGQGPGPEEPRAELERAWCRRHTMRPPPSKYSPGGGVEEAGGGRQRESFVSRRWQSSAET